MRSLFTVFVLLGALIASAEPKPAALVFQSDFGEKDGAVAFALNQTDFAAAHGVSSGPDWNVTLSRP